MDFGYHSSEQLKRIADWNTKAKKPKRKSAITIKRILFWFVVIFLVLIILATYRMEGRL